MKKNLDASQFCKKIVFVFVFGLLCQYAFSQNSISGPTCVMSGIQYSYTLSAYYSGTSSFNYSVSGGTLSTGGTNGSHSGPASITIIVTWTSNGSIVLSSPGGSPAILNVTVAPALVTGTITSGQTQNINYNTTPAIINCSAASGGTCGATNFAYQWQQSPDNVNYIDVSGATSQNLSFTTVAKQTTYYRRFVKELTSNNTGYSNVASVILNPPNPILPVNAGDVTPASQAINYNTAPALLTSTNVSGGTYTYTYQWQTSQDNTHWTNISCKATSFSPPNLTTTTYYRVTVKSNGVTDQSSSAVITVYPQLQPGAINPSNVTILTGTTPGSLTGIAPTGGTGTYTYNWQKSTDGINFSNISGATLLSYSPAALTVDTWYRLAQKSNGVTVYTNIAHITISTTSTADVNFIRERDVQKPGVTTTTAVEALTDPSDMSQTTQYFDGLGREIQTVMWQQTPSEQDLVKITQYDDFGREAYQYLPYAASTNDGNFKLTALADQNHFNANQFPNEQYYYGQVNFEPSPLNRVISSMPPGVNWEGSNRGTTNQYSVNTTSDGVRIWTIDFPAGSIPTTSSIYAAGTLYENISTDEANHQVIEYKDLDGKTVLKKVQIAASPGASHTGWLCTYYVYDIMGNLRFVIPPLAVSKIGGSWTISSTVADNLCYRYEYDERQRIIIKKIPGADEVWMVYDNRNRLVYTQDGNMRTKNWWLATVYDDLNRPVQTEMMTYGSTLSALQSYVSGLNPALSSVSAAGTGVSPIDDNLLITQRDPQRTIYQATNSIEFDNGFTSEDNASFTAEIISSSPPSYSGTQATFVVAAPSGATLVPLTMTFYDNYSFTSKAYSTTNNSKIGAGTNSYADALPSAASTMTKGMVTGTRIRAIENASDLSQGAWMEAASFYDEKGRIVQVQSDNYKGGADITTSRYDFSGQPIATYQVHNNASAGISNLTVNTNMNFDARGRLLNVQKSINDGTSKTTVVNAYNELGQLLTKSLGTDPTNSPNPLETLTYDYNIRGWLLGVNRSFAKNTSSSYTNYFGFDLGYDKTSITITGGTSGSYASPQYNGNISGMVWRTAGNGEIRKYDYTYDIANRLAAADFNQYTGSSFNKTANVDFSVSNLTYDANGNILSQRQMGLLPGGSNLIDDLTYTPISNSNQLKNVADVANNAQTTLGDFHYSPSYTTSLGGDKTASTVDYTYDVNGNLTKDKNKDITSISYNYLNLPYIITVTAKGTITYIYDALGNKLEKRTVDNTISPSQSTTTTYLGDFVYQNNLLQYFSHEEGRIRKSADGISFTYDYFLKDHLGNVRMVLTEEQKTDAYPTLDFEGTANTVAVTNQDAVWSNSSGGAVDVVGTRTTRPSNMGTSTSNGTYAKLITKSSSGGAIGAAMLLKVMSGDQINTSVDYFWPSATVNNSHADGIGTLINSLLTALAGSPAVSPSVKGSISAVNSGLTADPGVITAISTPENNASGSSQPKAYLHILLFDEQFVFDKNNSVIVQIGGSNALARISRIVSVKKNGYVYIYFSNESDNNVYFDNFKVTDVRGPILEETHYYPFGLTMSGISSKALNFGGQENKRLFNASSEIQNKEFSDLSGLELYTTNYRLYDPQLGRFWQVDPLADIAEYESPYAYASNNPILINDPFGLKDSLPMGMDGTRNTLNDVVVTTSFKKSGTNNSNINLFTLPNNERSHSDNTRVYQPIVGGVQLSPTTYIPSAIANQGFPEPPYPQGTYVRQFRTVKTETYVRVSNSVKGNVRGQWLVKESSIRGMTPEQLQQNLALDPKNGLPDQMGKVEVPEGTLLRAGSVGGNGFGPGNLGITQYQLMENIPDGNFYTPTPIEEPGAGMPSGVPMDEPIEPIEPVEPEIFPEIL